MLLLPLLLLCCSLFVLPRFDFIWGLCSPCTVGLVSVLLVLPCCILPCLVWFPVVHPVIELSARCAYSPCGEMTYVCHLCDEMTLPCDERTRALRRGSPCSATSETVLNCISPSIHIERLLPPLQVATRAHPPNVLQLDTLQKLYHPLLNVSSSLLML